MSAPLKKLKLFAGIALEKRVQQQLFKVAERLRARGLDGRFEAVEKYHLTVAFLGWIEPTELPRLAVAMQSVAERFHPFRLRFDRIAGFPHERRPRVVWIGCHKQPAAYGELTRSLQSAYAEFGFSFKDDPVAHVTIARIKEARRPLPSIDGFEPIDAGVNALTLFESLPAGGTTRYEARAQAPLSGA